MANQKLVLITGASGVVGPRVVDALCSAGYQVRSFSLDALPGAFPSGVQSLVGDVTDGQFHELRAIISAISSALGRKPPRFSIPVRPVRFAAGIIEDILRLSGRRSPINRATIDKYTEDIAVEGQRIQNELGFVPQYDLNAGWRETVGGENVERESPYTKATGDKA